VTNAYAIQSQLTNTLNFQVITNGYNFTANSPSLVANSSLTNAYGLYIAQQKVTGVTTGYGIYQENSADINYFNGTVGIGGLPGSNAKLFVTGAIGINSASFTADASLHIATIYGGAGRLTQMHPTGNSLNALNLMASTNGSGSHQWWSWGVNANQWTINPGTSFGTGFTINSSGNVGIGTTSPSSSKLVIEADGTSFGTYGSTINLTAASGTRYHIIFRENGTERGSITSNGTTAAYNSVSDHRLKEITGPITDSGSFIDALKPKVGTWKADGSSFVGFIAHEFAEVSPTSVSGEKDAVDAEGNPKYQSMQASSAEVIANLVAELQSLRARVAALESK
jgi:hypothetical protein